MITKGQNKGMMVVTKNWNTKQIKQINKQAKIYVTKGIARNAL